MASKREQYEKMIDWIFEHTYYMYEFILALKQCGFTEDEVVEMAINEGWDDDIDIHKIWEGEV